MTSNRALPGITGIGFATASAGLVAVLYSFDPFRHYAYLFGGLSTLFQPVPGALALAGGLALASATTLADAKRRARLPRHRLDWFFILVGLVAAVSLIAGCYEKGRGLLACHLLCLALLCGCGSYVAETMLVRLQAGTLRRTIFWPRVFRTLPLNQFSGAFIFVVVVIASIVVLLGGGTAIRDAAQASAYSDLRLSTWLVQWFASVILPSLTLAAVAVLCQNILSITAARQAGIEAQLREERFRAELITNVTHDLRTPLTSIVNYVDLIERLEIDDPRLASYTNVLSRKAGRLKVLIADLLDASRASAGTVSVHVEPIEVTEILAQIAGDFDDALTLRGLTWIGPPAGCRYVRADGEHLWRILENLVGNIVKYAKPDSCVHADLIESAGTIRLQLRNQSVEPLFLTAEQLTSQFVRGDTARNSEGSGLGLYIADRLARLMGGQLVIEVDGDRFAAAVELPAVDPPAVATPAVEAPGVHPELAAVLR